MFPAINEKLLVIGNLSAYLEADEIDNDKAPVRACHRYLSNRTAQLDYQGAIEKGLPIGSGEIESAYRYVIQKRLKLPGVWLKEANVEPMLAQRVVRDRMVIRPKAQYAFWRFQTLHLLPPY